MATPKIIWEPREEKNLHDKQKVESLRLRLNDIIIRDPEKAKKAAQILEQWMKKSKT